MSLRHDDGRRPAQRRSELTTLRVDEAQACQFPGTAPGAHELPACQRVINVGFARLAQEGDQHFACPVVGSCWAVLDTRTAQGHETGDALDAPASQP